MTPKISLSESVHSTSSTGVDKHSETHHLYESNFSNINLKLGQKSSLLSIWSFSSRLMCDPSSGEYVLRSWWPLVGHEVEDWKG